MYIHRLIPRNFAELAEAVPIGPDHYILPPKLLNILGVMPYGDGEQSMDGASITSDSGDYLKFDNHIHMIFNSDRDQ